MKGRRDVMRAVISAILLLAFIGAMAALFRWQVPAGNRDMVIYMLGQLSGFTAAAIAFYLGTSKSSADKNSLLSKRPSWDRERSEP